MQTAIGISPILIVVTLIVVVIVVFYLFKGNKK